MPKGTIKIKGDGFELSAIWERGLYPLADGLKPKWKIRADKGGETAREMAERLTADLKEPGRPVWIPDAGTVETPPQSWDAFAVAIATSPVRRETRYLITQAKAPERRRSAKAPEGAKQ